MNTQASSKLAHINVATQLESWICTGRQSLPCAADPPSVTEGKTR